MSKGSPTSPNRGETNLNSSQLSIGSLDRSIKDIYLILFYSQSDPGYEYELINSNELADGWQTLAVGEKVFSTFGKAKVQGEVVAISEDMDYLNSQFRNITERHSWELEKVYMDNGAVSSSSVRYYVQEPVVKVTDVATQTDPVSTVWRDKYRELEEKYERIREVFNAARCDIEDVIHEEPAKRQRTKTSSRSTLSPVANKTPLRAMENIENEDFKAMMQIGSHGTKIAKSIYDTINWTSYTAATRKLLLTFFTREVLATHSLTGKPSPAFLNCNKQKKARLDPSIVYDIVEVVTKNCGVTETLVRTAITTKCSDENKLLKKKMNKSK